MKSVSITLFILTVLWLLHVPHKAFSQGSPDYSGGLKVKLNEDGSKYFRLITWHQFWATFSQESSGPDFLLRRSRFLMFAQINKRFLILTHFGLNNLSANNLGSASPIGQPGNNGSFFMHDAWAEYTVIPKKLYIGGGLHYWNGISRLTSQSTLNFLTLDAPIHNWPTIGTSDQFARHLGLYLKGKIGKLDYRFGINEALTNPSRGANTNVVMASDGSASFTENRAIYRNPERAGGGKVFQGYLNYQFLDQESNTLPYFVGSYLGSKQVLNLGAGFFYHSEGASSRNGIGELSIHNPFSVGIDLFYDSPIGNNGAAVTVYSSYVSHDWGPNFVGGVGGVGTGNITYFQIGYVTPDFSKKVRLQPYFHLTNRNLESFEEFDSSNSTQFGLGTNWYLSGHNAKVTLEYQRNRGVGEFERPEGRDLLRVQLMIYL